MAFNEQRPETAYDLWTVPLESDGAGLRAGKPEVFLQTPADERNPSFSPDGRWLAYTSNESGTFQVYVRAFPDKGGKLQISNSGGLLPMWSRSGHELFFGTSDNHIMAAAYTVKGDSFLADKPRLWSDKPLGGRQGWNRPLPRPTKADPPNFFCNGAPPPKSIAWRSSVSNLKRDWIKAPVPLFFFFYFWRPIVEELRSRWDRSLDRVCRDRHESPLGLAQVLSK